MKTLAIKAAGLSKEYRIGGARRSYRTLRDTIMETATAPFRAMRRSGAPSRTCDRRDQRFWALKDVCFEVEPGQVVGVIGRNGAGKSTLLKLLSRITEPTGGFAEIHGQIGSLLEVGTGFHPELTGRDNIYLNGAILGMKRAHIRQRFDEIVAFAGVEKFIDTAVKHYSSGMYLRLAFAVAAHLDPEIMLIDEVLAVGDAAFQRKCLGRMGEVAKEGRTVLFVSHNMGAIRSLCDCGLVLHQGKLVDFGDISTAIQTYYRLASEEDRESSDAGASRSGFGRVQLASHSSNT
ncbi:MAG: ABC transporter ATP-binding protein, partial [Acidobacteriaceae bacterium]|nr:ABC transporter ATP-binding protein [Acidobacteriaceae bacterium]